nr:protein fluorescent in blue light, chloroplastic [Tanacetum cinerariifolium]
LHGETREPQVDSQTFVSDTNHEENDSKDDNHRNNLAKNNWSAKSFSALLELLHEAFFKDNELPVLTYQAKKLTCLMGLENLTKLDSDVTKNGLPAKLLWNLPIIPRLKKLYANPKDAKLLRWHAEERKNDGKMRHVATSPQWKNIDQELTKMVVTCASLGQGKLASLLVNVRDFRKTFRTHGACRTTFQKVKISRTLMELGATNVLLLSAPLEAMAETCEAEQSLFSMNMPLLLLVALIGASVGALKRQAKIESYAPTLTYAPVGSKIADKQVIIDPRKRELLSRLKNVKNFLRNQDPEKAFFEFKTALELAQAIKDPIDEKKATRGLGASLQRQRKYTKAVKYHSMVLSISKKAGGDSGNTEAFGAIADCYTELGELERAATFYD